MQKITPCLWFDMNCEEAINFYASALPNSKINSIMRYPEGMGGKILTAILTRDVRSAEAPAR